LGIYGIATSPDDQTVYVVDPLTGMISVYSAADIALLGEGRFTKAPRIANSRTFVAVAPDGLVYVGYVDLRLRFRIAELNASGALLRTRVFPFWSNGLDLTGDARLLVTGAGWFIDRASLTPVAKGQTGFGGYGVHVTLDGTLAYVSNYNSTYITVMDISTAVPPEPRSAGFWKHQCSDLGFHQVSTVNLDALFADVEAESTVFTECTAIGCGIFESDGPQNEMRPKAVRQLQALWLNVVSDRLPLGTPIDLPALTGAMTVGEAIDEVERAICDPHSSRSDLELAKEIAEALNIGGEDMELAGESTSLTLTPGQQKWVTLALINMGTYPRSYDVSASGPWNVHLSRTGVNGLAPGSIALFTLSAIAPAFSPLGSTAEIQVVAEDRHSDTSLQRELSLTFTVVGTGGGGSKRMLPPD
jgi:hypothetical protein